MYQEYIVKSIDIHASAEIVWKVLTNDTYVRERVASFEPWTYVISSWKEWADIERKIAWMLCAKWILTTYDIPRKIVCAFYEGSPSDWFKDTLSDWIESYELVSSWGHTTLNIMSWPFSPDERGQRWDSSLSKRDAALKIIKTQSENI
jgi:hypothetical protein